MSEKAFCKLSVVPVRAESKDRAEICTQLLFGELIEILSEEKNWYFIQTEDKYQGWIDYKQVEIISDKEYQKFQSSPCFYSSELLQYIKDESSKKEIPIIIGSRIPVGENNSFQLNNTNYSYSFPVKEYNHTNISEIALKFTEAPYLWGGKSVFGIDCSGLTQLIAKICGIDIPRDASQQADCGNLVSFVEEAEVGDFAFFDDDEGNIIHIGILLSKDQILHASGKVRIDAFDHHGIFNKNTNKYSHKLRFIKQIR
jgi:gamma-D-glutamyl-L-lysine dipeptidyl-peptidase